MGYGVYVHIPFCHGRCSYCDFYSRPVAGGVPDAYIEALLRAAGRHTPRDAEGAPLRPQSVYFGGGTPGLLAPAQVGRLLQALAPLPGAEITLETNPETTSAEKLAGWRAAGVNRLSVGVQTARDESLARLGRRHTAQDARQTLKAARAAGFENISGDVMLALPHYSRAELDETLELLYSGGARHISAYMLKLEPGTPFGKSPPAGLPGEDAAADFYLHACRALEKAGYAQYEISNFALPGCQGRHNLLYWDAQSWLGLGPAAHSCLFGSRYSFGADTGAFVAGGLDLQPEGKMEAEDYMMLRLRLAAGLDEEALRRRYGRALLPGQRALLEKLAQGGLARRTAGGWALTARGMLVQNSILAQLL